MMPDPTPVAGMSWPWKKPLPLLAWPWVTIVTIAGLTLSAAATAADDSSMVTACVPPVSWVGTVAATVAVAGLSRLPVATRMPYVPPAARTALRRDAATTGPTTPPRRRPSAGGAGVGVGSNQCSGVTGSDDSVAHAGRV